LSARNSGAVSKLHSYAILFVIQQLSDMTNLSLMHLMENGRMWRRYVFSASISSVQEEREFSQKQIKTRSFRLRTWSQDKVSHTITSIAECRLTSILGEQQPFIRNVFTLDSCAHIVGSHVMSFKKESDLLQAWKDFVGQADPDVVIGYNTSNFDFPYLLDRAKALKAHDFPYLGRIKGFFRFI
jgi:DNA polymerase elongation subunit (family B)